MLRHYRKKKLSFIVYLLIACQLIFLWSPAASAADTEEGGVPVLDPQAAILELMNGLESPQEIAAPRYPVLDPIPSPTNQNPLTITGVASPGATVNLRYGLFGSELQQIAPLIADENGIFQTSLPISTGDGRYVIKSKAIVDGAESIESEYGFDFDGTAPLEPRNARWVLFPGEKSRIILIWDVPFVPGSDTTWDESIRHYEIYRDSEYVANSIATSYPDMEIGDMEFHEYAIVAVDRAGNKSEPVHIHAGTGYYDATLVSPNLMRGLSNGVVFAQAMNGSGSKVAFLSNATDLVEQTLEQPDAYHLYFRDLRNNVTTLITRAEVGYGAAGKRLDLNLSGSVAVFVSDSQESAQDTNDVPDIYAYDEEAGSVELISEGDGGAQAPSIDDDGVRIVYEKTNGDGNEVVLFNRSTRQSTVIGAGQHPTISGDGKYVLFVSTEGLALYNTAQATTQQIRFSGDLEQAEFLETSLSTDGQTMAFTARRSDSSQTVYVYKHADQSRIEVYDTPGESLFTLFNPQISGNGQKLLFEYAHAKGTDFYGRADHGVMMYDIATKNPVPVANQALVTEKATMNETGSKITWISSNWDRSDGRNVYFKCFQSCEDIPPPADKPITYVGVYFQNMVNGQAPIGSTFTIATTYDKGKSLKAHITTRYLSGTESKETLELKEGEPGIYQAQYTLPPAASQITSVRVERTDKPELYKDAAPMPVKVAGQIKLTLDATHSSLLSGTKLIATSNGKKTGNQLKSDGRSEYVIPVGDAEDYMVQGFNAEGILLGTVTGVAVKNGEESVATLKLTASAKLTVRVKGSNGRMVPKAQVLVEKNGASNVYRTDDNGVVKIPGPHYQGDKLKVSIMAEKPYLPANPQEIELKMNENELLFDLPIMVEGHVKGKVVDDRGNVVDKPLNVIFYNKARRVTAVTGTDGQYEVDLPVDSYYIQVVSNQPPHYGIVYGTSNYVTVQESTAQSKNLTVSTVASRPMNFHLSVKRIDEQWKEIPIAGYDDATLYGLSVKSKSSSFSGNANNIRQNQLFVQGADGDLVTVCSDGKRAGYSSQCKEVPLNGAGETEVELQIQEIARIQGEIQNPFNSALYSLNLEYVEDFGKFETVSRLGLNGKFFSVSVARPGKYQLTLKSNRIYSNWSIQDYDFERVVLKTFTIADKQILDLGPIVIPSVSAVFAGKQGNMLETSTKKLAPGGIAKYRATYKYGGPTSVKDAQLLIHVPSGTELLANSVMLNGQQAAATASGSGLYSVPLGDLQFNASGTLYYQLKIDNNAKNGDIDAFLDLRFQRAEGQPYETETIGSDRVHIGLIELIAPKVVPTYSVYVRGTGVANKTVDLYVDGKAVRQLPISAGGTWDGTIELEHKTKSAVWRDNPFYEITAKVSTDEGVLESKTAYVEYDAETPIITNIEISQPGKSVKLDTSRGVPSAYMSIHPHIPVSFKVTATHPERIDTMSLYTGVMTEAKYDSKANVFRAAVDPTINRLSPNGVFVKFDTQPKPYELKNVDQAELDLAKQQLPEPWKSSTAAPATAEETNEVLQEMESEPATMLEDPSIFQTPFIKVNTSGKANEDIYTRMTFKKLTNYTPAKKYKINPSIPYTDLQIGFNGRTLRFSFVLPASYYKGQHGGIATFGELEHVLNMMEVYFPEKFGPINKLWGAKDLLLNYGDLQKFMDEVLKFQDDVINSECHAPTVNYFNSQIESLAKIAELETQMKYAIGSVAAAFSAVAMPAWLGFAISTATTVAGDVSTMDRDRIFKELQKEFKDIQKWRDDMSKAGVFPRCEDEKDDDEPDQPPTDTPDGPPGTTPLTLMKWSYDPSGYVYEGMTSNRIKDATATVFFKDAASRWMQWDASEYGQNNPLTTDQEGKYAWDVPEGLWKVKYEKEGYVPAESAELTVLPPHFDVNIPLISYLAPEFVTAFGRGGGESIQLNFSKPMQTASVGAANVIVKDSSGAQVAGTIEPVAPETTNIGNQLAMSYRFIPEKGPLAGGVYTVQVLSAAQSYAGVMLEQDATKEVRIDPTAQTPEIASNLILSAGDRSVTAVWEEASPSAANRIRLYIRKVGEAWQEPVTLASGELQYSFAGLEEGTDYEVKLVTVGQDDAESEGLTSKARTAETPTSPVDTRAPGEVAEANAQLDGQTIRVTWKDPEDEDFAKVRVVWKEKGGNAAPRIGYADQGDQQFVIEETSVGKTYEIKLVTIDNYLNQSTGTILEVSTADTQPPGDVTGFKASTDRESIILTWLDPKDPDLDHLTISWNEKGSAVSPQSIQVAKGQQKHTIGNLRTGKVYVVEIVAFDGQSNRSTGVKLEAKVLPTPHDPDPNPNPNPGPFPPGKDAIIIKLGKDLKYEGFEGKLQLHILPGTFKKEVTLQVNRREVSDQLQKHFKAASMGFELIPSQGEQPGKSTIITLQYDAERMKGYDPRRIGLYRKTADGKGWQYVGGLLNRKQQTISMPVDRFGTYALLIYDRTFEDLTGHWSRADVEVLISRNLMYGISDTEFGPNRQMTRAELISLLVRALPEANNADAANQAPKQEAKQFKDVSKTAWYYEEVVEAASRGLIQGSGGHFRPNDVITREEMIVIVLRALGGDRNGDRANLKAYPDGADTSDWAQSAIAYSVQNNWLNGILKDQLKPQAKATRAEAAFLVLRMLEQSGYIMEQTAE